MAKILVNESGPLHGTVQISGAKNAVLPLMAATLLTGDTCRIEDDRCWLAAANASCRCRADAPSENVRLIST